MNWILANSDKWAKGVKEMCFLTPACENSGEANPIILEIHHVHGKDREIGRMIAEGLSVEAIAAEIAKCQVLCSNYHKRLICKRAWII